MDTKKFKRISEYQWQIEPCGKMRVPVIIFADEDLISEMDEKVCEQAANVAALPGIVKASYAMPDAHWGYGFPIGGVAAFDPDKGGVISAGGVGFDISCGVRALRTNLTIDDIEKVKKTLADLLAHKIPAGVGSRGKLSLSLSQLDDMLTSGGQWAVEEGFGTKDDLQYSEENGCMNGAKPSYVSDYAKNRQKNEVGTLGSGNHYMEVQKVVEIFDKNIADAYGLKEGGIVISIHCGSRGLGHQIGTEFLKKMAETAKDNGIDLPERELACAPLKSHVGQQYLGAMRAGINCAIANRQVLTHLVREALTTIIPKAELKLIYDVSHNTCKEETHKVNGKNKRLFVHRKGATRAFGPGSEQIPESYRCAGQPVLIGGTMGTASYILAGTKESEALAFGSSCHGAGRNMSRKAATKLWRGSDVVRKLASEGIVIRSPSMRGVAEEAPDAYKNVDTVVDAAEGAGLSRKAARLIPMICVKG
ncbi:MAG: RtcB family protein [Phycisphaerae bacterium]|nr:RtcB family protein [Phycisphaerae bacterium]